jgi:serine/threonine protein kinase
MLMTKTGTHPHVLPLLHTEFDASSRVSMAVPIAPFGSMLDLADHLDFCGLELCCVHAAVVVLQVAQAVTHLREIGIEHGDVAARNVFVFEYDVADALRIHVRLGDFGEARALLCESRNSDCIRALARELRTISSV